jgi:hypothetical protein
MDAEPQLILSSCFDFAVLFVAKNEQLSLFLLSLRTIHLPEISLSFLMSHSNVLPVTISLAHFCHLFLYALSRSSSLNLLFVFTVNTVLSCLHCIVLHTMIESHRIQAVHRNIYDAQ